MIKVSFVSLLVAATLSAAPLADQESTVQKASAASNALLQRLGSELVGQMQNGGPMAALHFCSQNALHLTDQIGKEHNLSIKRVSLENRNPINMPSSAEKSVLERWKKMQQSGAPLPPYELTTQNGSYSYNKPITIAMEACLKRHGDISGNTALYKAIKELYPEDKATGYKMGDLRGMIVVTIPEKH